VPIAKVWVPVDVAVVITRSSPPLVDVANVCDDTELPLSVEIVPPAPPASVPQLNVPFAQRSFSVAELHTERLAPKSDASVRPPVDEALLKYRVLVVSPVLEALESVV
jgi:hypothetical protein